MQINLIKHIPKSVANTPSSSQDLEKIDEKSENSNQISKKSIRKPTRRLQPDSQKAERLARNQESNNFYLYLFTGLFGVMGKNGSKMIESILNSSVKTEFGLQNSDMMTSREIFFFYYFFEQPYIIETEVESFKLIESLDISILKDSQLFMKWSEIVHSRDELFKKCSLGLLLHFLSNVLVSTNTFCNLKFLQAFELNFDLVKSILTQLRHLGVLNNG